jgi:hypothetical protein
MLEDGMEVVTLLVQLAVSSVAAMVIGRTILVAWMDAERAIRAAHRATDPRL